MVDRASPELGFTWWGHASATVELGGVRVATDPLLGGPAVPPAPVRRATPGAARTTPTWC